MCIIVEKFILCLTSDSRPLHGLSAFIAGYGKKKCMSSSKQLEGCWDCGLASGRETFQRCDFTCDSGAAGCYAAAISRDMVFPSGAFQSARTTGMTENGSVNTCHPELNNIRQITKGRAKHTRLINAFDDVRLTFMFYLEHLDFFASGFTANESQKHFSWAAQPSMVLLRIQNRL